MFNKYYTIGIAIALAMFSAPFAQDDGGSIFDTPSTTTPVSTPSYSSPSSGSSDAMAPRTPSYGDVMQYNAAADFTTADYIVRPSLIGDNQFVILHSGGAGLIDAAFSLQAMGMNWFGSMENNARAQVPINSRVRLGIGSGNVFGAGIMVEFNKNFDETDVTGVGVTTTNTTDIGDAYGVFGSVQAGPLSIFGDISRETGPDQSIVYEDPVPTNVEDQSVTNNVNVGVIKDTEGQGNHAFGALVNISQFSSDLQATTLDDNSGLTFGVGVFEGIPVLYNDDAALFLGAGAGVSYMTTSHVNVPGGEDDEGTLLTFNLIPNLGAQKKLGKGFEATMGASVNLLNMVRTTGDVTLPAPVISDVISDYNNVFTGVPGAGDVAFGLRWAIGSFAIEGQIAAALLTAGPNFIGGGAPGMFGSVGVAAGF